MTLRDVGHNGTVTDPLHEEPSLPIVVDDCRIENPLSVRDPIALRDDQPIAYDQLRPSSSYWSPGFEYFTDEHGLPARVRGQLRLVPAQDRVRHPNVQRSVGHLSSDSPHHGGHIVAVSLGGFASGPNLFPQAANFNVSAFARLERSWRCSPRRMFSVCRHRSR